MQALFVEEIGLAKKPGGRKVCLLAIHVRAFPLIMEKL
jgi:hypothetical protein